MADDSEVTETTDIWASPSNAPPTIRPKTPRTPKTPKTPTGQPQPQPQPERTEPVDPEAALRKELEGVRNVNESLEGVIATLERAGGNMNVGCGFFDQWKVMLTLLDRFQHRKPCLDFTKHLDTNPIPDRTQPTTHPAPGMEGHHRRHGRARGGGSS